MAMLLDEEKKVYQQPRSMRQAMQQAAEARGAGLQPAATEPPAQQPQATTPAQTDPAAPAGYNLGKKVGGMFGGLKDGIANRVNRQIDLVTAAPRAAMQFGENVVRGMRGESPNTQPFTMSPSSAQAATPQAPGNMDAFRQVEAQNPEPGRLGAMLSAREDRQADAMLYGDQAKIVGGNSPQAVAAMATRGAAGAPGISVNLSPQDQQLKANMGKIDQMLASGVQPTQQQAVAIDQLRRDAGFLRGGTDRVPVGPDGRPIARGAGLNTGGRYSFQGTQDAAEKFVGAVSPGEYSPEAVAARDMQNKQFLTRQGVEEVDPVTGMTASQQMALPVKERVALAGARLQAKTAADSNAVAKMQAEGTLELGRGNLAVNQADQATKAKGAGLDMTAKQMEIERAKQADEIRKAYAAETDPAKKKAMQEQMFDLGLVARPEGKFKAVTVKRPAVAGSMAEPGEDLMVLDERTGRMVPGGGAAPQFDFNDTNNVQAKEYLKNLKLTNPQEYERLRQQYAGAK